MPHADPWDPTTPLGSESRTEGDDRIREAKRGVEQRANLEHQAMSDIDDGGRHLLNSARISVGTLAARPVYSTGAFGIGRVHLVHDPPSGPSHGRGYVCVDDTSDVWVELTDFGTAVTFSAQVTALAGLTIPTGQLITGPTGEEWLTDGVETMDPVAHAARHEPGGGDPIRKMIQAIAVDDAASSTSINDALVPGSGAVDGHLLASEVVDTSGRGATSTFLVIGHMRLHNVSAAARRVNTAITRTNNTALPDHAWNGGGRVDAALDFVSMSCIGIFRISQGLTRTLEFRAGADSGVGAQAQSAGMLVIDLGTIPFS